MKQSNKAMATKNKNDIRITRITKEFGDPEITRDKLKSQINDELVQRQLTRKYGLMQSIRMPFSQTSRGVWYFGFLTLVDPDTHNELVQDLTKNPIKFGDMELKFEMADSRRSPTKPACKRKEDNSKEEDVVMLSRKMGSIIPATCFKRIKVELQEPAHILVDSAANDGEGNVERHDLEKRIEEIKRQEEEVRIAQRQLDQWDQELQGREQAYWENRRADDVYEARLRFLDAQAVVLEEEEERIQASWRELGAMREQIRQRDHQVKIDYAKRQVEYMQKHLEDLELEQAELGESEGSGIRRSASF